MTAITKNTGTIQSKISVAPKIIYLLSASSFFLSGQLFQSNAAAIRLMIKNTGTKQIKPSLKL
ncbi:MAG: hypothetical protein ABL952_05200 [Pyrinomonadaceae bacterium]